MKKIDWVQWVNDNKDKLTISSYADESLSAFSFNEGARIATEYMIEKACAWLNDNSQKYIDYDNGLFYVDRIHLVEDFKQAMKG